MWYSHMQEPLKYAADCQRLGGYLIDHKWTTEGDRKKRQEESDNRTFDVWKNEFQAEMSMDHLFNTKENFYEDP